MVTSDVTIGSGEEGVTTITIFIIPGLSTLSSNKRCFRAQCLLGISATIFRDTPEGKTLQEMIDSNKCASDIQNFLDSSVLKAVDFDLLKVDWKDTQQVPMKKGTDTLKKECVLLWA